MMFYIPLSLIIIIGIIGNIWTIAVVKRQRNQVLDKGLNAATRKRQILANPILIAYVLFPILIILGAAILIYYYGG